MIGLDLAGTTHLGFQYTAFTSKLMLPPTIVIDDGNLGLPEVVDFPGSAGPDGTKTLSNQRAAKRPTGWKGLLKTIYRTLCCVIVFPGRRSGFRAGFRPDSNRKNLKIGPPAGRGRPEGRS